MTTFSTLVDDTLTYLRSYVRDQELSTHLTAGINASALSLPLASTAGVSRGRVEIGDELIWIDSADRNGTTATIPPYGRGMDGTTAAAHSSGDRVVVQPLYPRHTVKTVINQSIRTIGATLYGVASTSLTPPAYGYTYVLPSVVRDVLSVRVSDERAGGEVIYLRKWSMDKNAPTVLASTGKALYVKDAAFLSPTTVEVVYSRDPIPLSADTDDFSTTLLPSTSEDLVVLLSASRLLATADSYNLQTRAVEANTMDSKVPPGEGVRQSKYLYQLYAQRLDEERRRLLNATVTRMHYAR